MTVILLLSVYRSQCQIMEELRRNGVEIYKFPTDDETISDLNAKMNVSVCVCVCVYM